MQNRKSGLWEKNREFEPGNPVLHGFSEHSEHGFVKIHYLPHPYSWALRRLLINQFLVLFNHDLSELYFIYIITTYYFPLMLF